MSQDRQPETRRTAGPTDLKRARGPHYWRSLDEFAQTPEFDELLHREFPEQASEFDDPAGRRRFLKLMAASLALAGVGACRAKPTEHIVPYVRSPEEVIPGKPLFFATAMTLSGVATGLLVESHTGRPTKIEGNPDHPSSLGATDVFSQASVLDFYDPDRSQAPLHLGAPTPWSLFVGEVRGVLETLRQRQGAGLRILTETMSSPTAAHQLRQLLEELPEARWHRWEPAGRDNVRAGAAVAFGAPVETRYRFDLAEVIVSLDADFLSSRPATLRYLHDFAQKRRLHAGKTEMNRLYVVESTPSTTGAKADHRLPLRPSAIEPFARALAAAVGVAGVEAGEGSAEWPEKWIEAIADDLGQHRGTSIVIAGDYQASAVHALAHAMNRALGNIGATVAYTDPVEAEPVDQVQSLRELVADMGAGRVEMLLILGGNPAYTAPADLRFAEALSKVPLRIHHGLYHDETGYLCHWHIPESHYLESWSDARAWDGTVSIVQPLIEPLYETRTIHEMLAVLSPEPGRLPYDIVRQYWTTEGARHLGADVEAGWRRALHHGIVDGTAFDERSMTPGGEIPPPPAPPEGNQLEIVFRPDPTVFDGRFANNGWLQELPKPLTKLTWDNAVFVSPRTAELLQLRNEDQVELSYGGRTIVGPAWVFAGHADDCVTVHLGYGRTRSGRVGNGAGFDAYVLRTSDHQWWGTGVTIRRTGRRHRLAATQRHHNIEGRINIRSGDLETYREDPGFVHHVAHKPPTTLTLYPRWEYPGLAWGMVIDQNACVGCNACVVACHAENNVPVVGKEQVAAGREMHWLRIDTYHRGPVENPATYFQPMLCVHCETAPCEVVCPVAATTHSDEGLNEMVYNRCIGTRYCSNNCPYKVRRFNFLLYSDFTTESLKLQRNPDVTVRSRGVMEKCTFCVQRINHARIEAKVENREIRDGDVVTACQAACPAQAIVFGNLNDPQSRVAALRGDPLNYGVLEEISTFPRATHLGIVRNPNPALEPEGEAHGGGHGGD
jgi:MoCo/4Fe-4S cofactor protein with predicted Tat translocation signal